MLQQNFSSAATDFWFLTIFEKNGRVKKKAIEILKVGRGCSDG